MTSSRLHSLSYCFEKANPQAPGPPTVKYYSKKRFTTEDTESTEKIEEILDFNKPKGINHRGHRGHREGLNRNIGN